MEQESITTERNTGVNMPVDYRAFAQRLARALWHQTYRNHEFDENCAGCEQAVKALDDADKAGLI